MLPVEINTQSRPWARATMLTAQGLKKWGLKNLGGGL